MHKMSIVSVLNGTVTTALLALFMHMHPAEYQAFTRKLIKEDILEEDYEESLKGQVIMNKLSWAIVL